jgi:hypothetical protein
MFLYSYETEYLQKLIKVKKKKINNKKKKIIMMYRSPPK